MYILLKYSKHRTIKTMKTGEPPHIKKQSMTFLSHKAVNQFIALWLSNAILGFLICGGSPIFMVLMVLYFEYPDKLYIVL